MMNFKIRTLDLRRVNVIVDFGFDAYEDKLFLKLHFIVSNHTHSHYHVVIIKYPDNLSDDYYKNSRDAIFNLIQDLIFTGSWENGDTYCSAPVEFGILGSYIKTQVTGVSLCPENAKITQPKLKYPYYDDI